MQVYKTFFKIAKKYLGGCLIYLTVFMVLMVSMSMISSKEGNDRFSAKSIKFTVIDEDNSQASKALIEYLSSKHELIEMKSYDKESLQDNLYYEEISYILNIPEDYEEKLEKGSFQNLLSHTMKSDSAAGYFFNQDLDSYISTLRLNLSGGYSLEEAIKETADTVKNTDTEVDTIKFEKVASQKENGIFYFFQYFGYIIISILLVGISPILISFRQADLSARISCSSYSKVKQSIGIGLGCLTYSLAQWLVMVICSIVFYGPEQAFSRNGILCLLNSLIYTIVVIAITLLVGSFKLSSSALSLVANVIGLGTSFLCGIFVPLWLLSDKVIAFSKFLPTYWFIKNNNMISGFSGEAVSLSSFWNNIFIQLLFAVAIFCIYLVLNISRKRKSI